MKGARQVCVEARKKGGGGRAFGENERGELTARMRDRFVGMFILKESGEV